MMDVWTFVRGESMVLKLFTEAGLFDQSTRPERFTFITLVLNLSYRGCNPQRAGVPQYNERKMKKNGALRGGPFLCLGFSILM